MRRLGTLGVLAAAVVLLSCGCGSRTAPASAPQPAAAAALSLAGSQSSGPATWAVLPMGAASGPNQFWQLFLLPDARHPKWTLDTPPDVATNGALALGGLSGTSLVAGVLPSLYLAFSPISATTDGGQHWTTGPPADGLASVPDALAATPGSHHLLSLSKSGQVSTASTGGASWTRLTSRRSLAATSAGRACGLSQLTGVAYSPARTPLLAGACSRPGTAGIFTNARGSWRAAGPSLPAALADSRIQVLRLVTTATATTALLQAGTGPRAELVTAWLDQRGRWTLSPPLRLAGSAVRTTAFGSSGAAAVVLSGGHADILSRPGGSWRQTPPVPAGRSVTIALPRNGPAEALAADGGTLTVWRLRSRHAGWARIQAIKVPIQYGSSS
jgi:hypothetical protein